MLRRKFYFCSDQVPLTVIIYIYIYIYIYICVFAMVLPSKEMHAPVYHNN